MSVLHRAIRYPSCLHYLHSSGLRHYTAEAVASASKVADDSVSPIAGPSHDTAVRQLDSLATEQEPKIKSKRQRAPRIPAFERRLEPSKTELFLDALDADGRHPSLSDLERLKPRRYPEPDTPQYPDEYKTLLDTVCRSFTKSQLRAFTREYDFDFAKKNTDYRTKKVQFAEIIVQRVWNWPSLKDVKRRKQERTEIVVQTFPLSPGELFVILGKDGHDLLEISRLFNVHVSLTERPLGLRVEGIKVSLQAVEDHLAGVKRNIIDETFEVHSGKPVPSELLQRISRMVAAFMINLGNTGTIRIYARDPNSLLAAKRLVTRAAVEDTPLTLLARRSPGTDDFVVPTAAPMSYALYPFLSAQSLPWMISPSGAFRWRRVGHWFNGERDSLPESEGIVSPAGAFMTVQGEEKELKSHLLEYLPTESHGTGGVTKRTITASPGHIVFSSPDPKSKPSLAAPTAGHLSFAQALGWMSKRPMPAAFISSLPPDFIEGRPLQQTVLHRLVYQALSRPGDTQGEDGLTAKPAQHVRFEFTLAKPSTTLDTIGDEEPSTELRTAKCWAGATQDVHLLLPDRTMDLCLSVSDSTELTPDEEPSFLRDYTTNLRDFLTSNDPDITQPTAPLTMYHQGQHYLLVTSASVRQSKESMSHCNNLETTVTTESVLDLESGQKYSACLITCDGLDSLSKWHAFLEDCDRLTARSYTNRHQTSFTIPTA